MRVSETETEGFANCLQFPEPGLALPKRPPVLHQPPLSPHCPPDLAPLPEASDFLPKAEQAPARRGPPDLVGRSPNPLQMGRWLAPRAQLPVKAEPGPTDHVWRCVTMCRPCSDGPVSHFSPVLTSSQAAVPSESPLEQPLLAVCAAWLWGCRGAQAQQTPEGCGEGDSSFAIPRLSAPSHYPCPSRSMRPSAFPEVEARWGFWGL